MSSLAKCAKNAASVKSLACLTFRDRETRRAVFVPGTAGDPTGAVALCAFEKGENPPNHRGGADAHRPPISRPELVIIYSRGHRNAGLGPEAPEGP